MWDTHWQTDRHTTTAYTTLSTALRSKNWPYCTAHQSFPFPFPSHPLIFIPYHSSPPISPSFPILTFPSLYLLISSASSSTSFFILAQSFLLPLSIIFSPLGKPADRAIYFTFRNFFLFFFFFFFNDFSETNYLRIHCTDFRNLFTEWKHFGCRWSMDLFFDISRNVAMATNFGQNCGKNYLPLHLSLCHSETEWDIALRIRALIAPIIALHRVKKWWKSVQQFLS